MTERSKARRGPGAMPVIVTALGGFLIVLTILSLQMRAGKDPAVRPAVAAAQPRTILERRIVKRRVIITHAPADTSGPAGGQASAPAPAASRTVSPAPVQVVQAAPASGARHEDVMTDRGHDLAFRCMGSDMRVLVGEPLEPGMPDPAAAAAAVRSFLADFDRRLSRFRPESELSALNRDARPVVPASELLRNAARAALWAAERTGGLVDPTMVGELEQLGYASSRDGVVPASVSAAVAAAPRPHPAHPDPHSRWREIRVDDRAGTVERPPGVRLDSGGAGKGLAADMAAGLLSGYARFVVDCGGDLRVGGPGAQEDPYPIEVEHPLTGERVLVLRVAGGGVATSGINVRLWRTGSGRFAHHLLDPESGEPAWTGLVGVTALGATALEAETLAKAALLSGPEAAHAWIEERGGVLVHDSGEAEHVGLRELSPERVRFVLPAPMRAA